jgi:hypothetical protein
VFRIFDLVDPTTPVIVSEMGLEGTGTEIALSGNYAYVALGGYEGLKGLQVVDIADPANPATVDTCSARGDVWDIAISGYYAYLAIEGNENGLEVFNIIDSANPMSVGFSQADFAYGVFVKGLYCYLGAEDLRIYDVSDVTDPIEVGRVAIAERPRDVVVYNGFAYVANYAELCVVDVTDPTNPSLASNYGTHFSTRIEQRANRVYVADRYSMTMLHIVGDTTDCPYVMGNANGDGVFGGLDVIYTVNYLKGRGSPPPDSCDCPPHGSLYVAADANGNCTFNGVDVTYSVSYLKGVGPPPRPCPDCPPNLRE